jgi:histidinol-phosphate aminotransferase
MGRARIKKSITRISPYVPGTSSHDIGRPVVKLSSNENPYGPSPKAVEAIISAAAGVNTYPDKESRELRSALSDHLRVPAGCVMVGNGSDEILENLGKLFLSEGDNLVTHSAFSTYQTVPLSLGAERRLVGEPPDHGIDVEGLKDTCDARTKILLVCTPNNPTGAILTPDQVDELLSFTADRGIFLVLDEAYADFSENYSSPAARVVEEGLDAAVTRTFSKVYGLAGVRIGYGIATEEVVAHVNLVRMPFNASSLAQAGAIAALGDATYRKAAVEMIRRGREYLADGLRSLGLAPLPSEANFLMVPVGPLGYTGRSLMEALLERGFAVRDCSSFGLPDHVRVSVGTDEQNAAFISALGDVLG